MNLEANAERKWEETDDYKTAANADTLVGSDTPAFYLRNRLHNAFQAGLEAGKNIAAQRLAAAAVKVIEAQE